MPGGGQLDIDRYDAGYRGWLAGAIGKMRAEATRSADTPEHSAFLEGWRQHDSLVTTTVGSRIEGIGRQRVEPSFIASAIDRMMRVSDAASVATIQVCEELLGRRVGASTGTGLWAAFRIADQMIRSNQAGSIITLLCDGGERYADKYYNPGWLKSQGLEVEPYATQLRAFLGFQG